MYHYSWLKNLIIAKKKKIRPFSHLDYYIVAQTTRHTNSKAVVASLLHEFP